MKKPVGILVFNQRRAYLELDVAPDPDSGVRAGMHISDVYAGWFQKLFGIGTVPSSLFPFVHIPAQWQEYAKDQLKEWGFKYQKQQSSVEGKLLFINPYAKTKKRCWPLERVVELVAALNRSEEWRGTHFIVNIVPEEMAKAKAFFEQHAPRQIRLLSAQENFFQLPAILLECDLIVSVDTAVTHLANAVHVPVVALMR